MILVFEVPYYKFSSLELNIDSEASKEIILLPSIFNAVGNLFSLLSLQAILTWLCHPPP